MAVFLRRLCFILSALTPFLLFQFYFLHKLTNDGRDSTERIAYQLGTTFETVMITPSKKSIKPVKEDHPLPFSWSACLLIKDGNVLLPEWLAYHYTVLPLRRLIVAVDPASSDDPQPILDMYGTIGMNVTVWTNRSYWINGRKEHEKREFNPSEEFQQSEFFYRYVYDRHVYNQKIFYTQCLRTLKKENRTWTTIIDVDEYLAFNYYHPKEAKATWCLGNVTCENEYLATINSGKQFRTKLNQSGTAAEWIAKNVELEVPLPSGVNPALTGVDYNFNVPGQPCIVIDRYLMNSKESDGQVIQQGVDKGFNATKFHTLRFHHRVIGRPQPGKCIIDASRSKSKLINSPHRLYKKPGDGCTGGGARVHNAAMSFRVHHYVGSFETFRLRGITRGSRDDFNRRNNAGYAVLDPTTPQYSSPENGTWLSQFVKLVGKQKALELTQRVRLREEWVAERNLLKPKKLK